MTAAIFGLLGVLVGGVLNGALARRQAERELSDAVRAGARLLFDEMARGGTIAKVEVGDRIIRSQVIPTAERWTEYEELFARGLPTADWLKLRQAVIELRALGHYQPVQQWTTSREDDDPQELNSADEARAAAMDVLLPLVSHGTHRTLRRRLRARRASSS